MSRPLIRSCHVAQGYTYVRKLPQSFSDEGRYGAAGVAKKIKYTDNIELLLYNGARLGLNQDIVCSSQPSNINCMRSPKFPNYSTYVHYIYCLSLKSQ